MIITIKYPCKYRLNFAQNYVLAQKKIKSETVETYYEKLKKNEKRKKAKKNVQ